MAKPTVVVAKHSPFFSSFWNAAIAAYAQKIAAHLCHRRRRPLVAPPRHFMDHVRGRLAA